MWEPFKHKITLKYKFIWDLKTSKKDRGQPHATDVCISTAFVLLWDSL